MAWATKTEQAMKLPPSERPVLEYGPPSEEQGDQALWISSSNWWLQDVLQFKADFWDAHLLQEHSLAMGSACDSPSDRNFSHQRSHISILLATVSGRSRVRIQPSEIARFGPLLRRPSAASAESSH